MVWCSGVDRVLRTTRWKSRIRNLSIALKLQILFLESSVVPELITTTSQQKCPRYTTSTFLFTLVFYGEIVGITLSLLLTHQTQSNCIFVLVYLYFSFCFSNCIPEQRIQWVKTHEDICRKNCVEEKVSTSFFRCRFKAIISAMFTESGLLSFTAFNLSIFPLEHLACHVMHVVHCATAFKPLPWWNKSFSFPLKIRHYVNCFRNKDEAIMLKKENFHSRTQISIRANNR